MTKKVSSKMSKYKVVWSDCDDYVYVYADTNKLFRRYRFIESFSLYDLICKAKELGVRFYDIRYDYVMQASLAVVLCEESDGEALLEHMKCKESKRKLEEWDGVIDGKYRQIV